jgi:hypothetical protein
MHVKYLAIAGLAVSLSAIPAFGHHSFAMFDQNRMATISGTAKEFEWINPHVWLHITADVNGRQVTYSFEGGSTGQLMQSGWMRESVKLGDRMEVTFHPLKDGSYGGQLLNVKFPDGKELCQGADCRARQNAARGGAPAAGGGGD